jgi:3-oxoacyl-[acyl-carrier-protein] synthase II
MRRRVVVTGLGLVTPLGTGVEKNWSALVTGRSGIAPVTRFDAREFPVRIAGEVRDFVATDFIERREIKKMDPFIQYAIAAAQMAFDGAGLRITPEIAERVGVIVGVGLGGMITIEETHADYLVNRLRRVSPFFVSKVIANLAPGQIAIRFGAKGVNFTSTSACASGATAIGEAFRYVRDGYQDVRSVVCRWAASTRCVRSRRATTIRSAQAAHSIAGATASSWPRVQASWCWRPSRARRPAARRSSPR